ELLDHIGFRKSLLDVTILGKRRGDIPCSSSCLLSSSSTQVRRTRRHDLRQSRCERKHLVVHFDRVYSVLGQVLGLCGHNSDDVTLEEKFFRQRIRFRSILRREYVRDTGDLPRRRSVQFPNSGVSMRAGEQLRKEHIRKPDPGGVLGLARKPRY